MEGFHNLYDSTAEGNQRKGVRNYHQPVEKVSQLPDQINFQGRTDNDKDNHQSGIYFDCFFSKKVVYIDRTEKLPANDSRKCEEKQADSDENIAKGAKSSGKSALGKGNALFSISQNPSG